MRTAAIRRATTVLVAAMLVAHGHRTAAAAEPDPAYAAFQRGYYLTAFALATDRVETKKDVKAMTLLGELYAGGLGIRQDDAKAGDWYKLAADRGDRNAMFALAMFRLQGRAGPRDRDAAAKSLAAAAKLGHAVAAYDLALLYIEGQLFPQDFNRAAELLRAAALAGNPEAQYALGTLYKQGRGVPKDMKEATRLWALASLADNTDAEVEYGIALFNGDGVAKNEQEAAAMFRKAAQRGNAVGQDRLARILAEGRGAPANPVEATKWHLISKARGETDLMLDDFVNKLDANTRAAGEKAAKPWLDVIKRPRS
jgi:TPR repeat protein